LSTQFVTSGYLNWSGFVIRGDLLCDLGTAGLPAHEVVHRTDTPPVRANSARFQAVSGPD
jgi:hypothetical protein